MADKNFEKMMKRLEIIVDKLESNDQSLEDSLESFKEGIELVKDGMSRLNEMERKVELLLQDVDADNAIPFAEDANDEEAD